MTPWDAAVSGGPPTSFTLDGEEYHLRGWGLDTVAPVAAFEHESWPYPLLAAVLTPESLQKIVRRLMDPLDGLDTPDLLPIAEDLVEAVYGRPYWTTGRLLAIVVTEWGLVDGALTLEGIDLLHMLEHQPRRAINTLYMWVLRIQTDDARRRKLETDLTTPPPERIEQDPDLGAEVEAEMFMAAFAQHGARL